VCCLRVPHEGKPGRRLQEVQTYSTTSLPVIVPPRSAMITPRGAMPRV
jgi:hypothetical protein